MIDKRFNYHIDEVGVYYYVCDNTKKGDEKIIFEFDTKFDAMEVCELLNKLWEENERLEERNNRQVKRLVELYELILKKDWESLTEIIDDFKRCEEQLQREWRTYE